MATAKRTTSPAFQFYPKDFLASSSVDLMSMTERGIYITLLSRAWLDGGLPTDLKALAAMCRMKPSQFVRVWESGPLHAVFFRKGDRLVNPRLEEVRSAQAAYSRAQSENGRKGGRPRNPSVSHVQDVGLTKKSSSSSSASSSAKKEEGEGGTRVRVSSLQPVTRFTSAGPEPGWCAEFIAAYPEHRRQGGYAVESAYVAAYRGVLDPLAHRSVLLASLEIWKASAEWRTKPRVVPNLSRWLSEEWWTRVPTPADAIEAPRAALPAWARKAEA